MVEEEVSVDAEADELAATAAVIELPGSAPPFMVMLM
jgi:hypothetical protein